LHRPVEMLSDADIDALCTYMVTQMAKLLENEYLHWMAHKFVPLCDQADGSITLFNARRGGKLARLTIANWLDAKCDVWLNTCNDRIDNMNEPDRMVFRQMKVMYQTGTGNRLVPFLVPLDTLAALDKLSDAEVHADCDVGLLSTNRYLFPSTSQSTEHVYGWLTVHKVSPAAALDRPYLI